MNLADTCRYVWSKGIDISKQGLYSAALVYGFVYAKDGVFTYDKDKLDEYLAIKQDKHPEYVRIYFNEYEGTLITILAKLLKADIKYIRYGMYYIIYRKDVNRAEELLTRKRVV
jgi:hypothetical protein